MSDVGILEDVETPHPEIKEIVYHPVDWTAMVRKGSQVHLLHGGRRDTLSCLQAARHLHRSWGAGVVMVRTPAQATELAHTLQRVPGSMHVLVCIGADTVSRVPHVYDAIMRQSNVTLLLCVPIMSVTGKPYSRRHDVVAVMLPSCRVDMDNMHDTGVVYRFPRRTVLQHSAWLLPQGMGITWRVGVSKDLTYVSFDPVVSERRDTLLDVQLAVDRAWYWNRVAVEDIVLTSLPLRLESLVMPKGAPFYPARELNLRVASSNELEFDSSLLPEEVVALRSDGAVSGTAFDVHLLDTHGNVIPVQMCLANAASWSLQDGAGDGGKTLKTRFRAQCTFAAATSPSGPVGVEGDTTEEDQQPPTPKWKVFSGVH